MISEYFHQIIINVGGLVIGNRWVDRTCFTITTLVGISVDRWVDRTCFTITITDADLGISGILCARSHGEDRGDLCVYVCVCRLVSNLHCHC